MKDPCWKGYRMLGTKKKGDKEVPNCVPEETNLEESPAWARKEGKNQKGGLNEKGRKSYEKEHPGSNLKPPVKKEQAAKSKKSAARRKSYCARSAGQAKMFPKAAKDPNSRLNKARRAWDC